MTFLWYGSIAIIIYLGWTVRDQRYLIAETGTGYWLGIIGGSAMLLLLVYPLRKKNPRWRFIGSVKFWFRLHMILGVVGPTLIILHSGYRLGSVNGTVAFICMLVVASSGLIGRYLYRRIHHGLYGEKINFEEIYLKDEDWGIHLKVLNEDRPEIVKQIQDIEQILINRHTGKNRSLWTYYSMRWKLGGLRKTLSKIITQKEDMERMLERVSNLMTICRLGINEILFSYWHILHFPLFIMMVFSGITHVIVVHFY